MLLDHAQVKLPDHHEKLPLDQIGAWMLADTLQAHLGREGLTPDKAWLLKKMAQELAEWLEGAAG